MKTSLVQNLPSSIIGSLLCLATSLALAADLNVPTATYPTIQAAVNAAHTNDTIKIAPGVYTNQVQIISKKLTLIGQPGTILRATKAMSPIQVDIGWFFPMMDIRSSDVTVRGLTFEAERLAGRFVPPGELKGILLHKSSANVENCAFYGFRESAPGPEYADPIAVGNVDANEVNMRVVGNTFADNYGGIYLIGSPTNKSINVTIENNTIVGLGPRDTGYNYSGIEMQQGVGGRIAGNTISGFSYVGTAADFDISFGILASGGPAFGVLPHLEIEGNALRDNQVHIALTKADGSVVRNNRFQGTAPGIVPIGLSVSGTNMTIANNQFEDLPEGIRLLGNDPIPGLGLGDILGFAVNAQVTSNRFCNVTTPINRQPPATATETGTLVCPFPFPTLAIANAVMLSWPNYADGWTLESAPDPLGPWTPLDVAPSVQDGQYVFAVQTAGQRRFFRLRQP